MKRKRFPFSAIVGQEPMKTALLLNAVDPTMGGVLIRGQKGTGKSTAARSLAGLLPPIDVVRDCPFHCTPDAPEEMHDDCQTLFFRGDIPSRTVQTNTPMVELPLNATEDRVAGTLQIEKALRTGERKFEPGLLAAANRGILYVDEVNLLEDHLVDLLLDAAASGLNVVEREGISYTHPASFILIGTMNPEEGELRPQFQDRFGLCVTVKGLAQIEARRMVVQRHLAFEKDSRAFTRDWADDEKVLTRMVRTARKELDSVSVPEELLDQAVRLAVAVKAQGHRADITMIKAARALAALIGEKKAGPAELAEAARYVLPHRMPHTPLGSEEGLYQKIDAALESVFSNDEGLEEESGAPDVDEAYMPEDMQVPGAAAAGSLVFFYLKKKSKISASTRTP